MPPRISDYPVASRLRRAVPRFASHLKAFKRRRGVLATMFSGKPFQAPWPGILGGAAWARRGCHWDSTMVRLFFPGSSNFWSVLRGSQKEQPAQFGFPKFKTPYHASPRTLSDAREASADFSGHPGCSVNGRGRLAPFWFTFYIPTRFTNHLERCNGNDPCGTLPWEGLGTWFEEQLNVSPRLQSSFQILCWGNTWADVFPRSDGQRINGQDFGADWGPTIRLFRAFLRRAAAVWVSSDTRKPGCNSRSLGDIWVNCSSRRRLVEHSVGVRGSQEPQGSRAFWRPGVILLRGKRISGGNSEFQRVPGSVPGSPPNLGDILGIQREISRI